MTGTPENLSWMPRYFLRDKKLITRFFPAGKTLTANPILAARIRPVLRSVLKEMLDVR
jgi:hypothetical protein